MVGPQLVLASAAKLRAYAAPAVVATDWLTPALRFRNSER
jgi:hypothetical protein